MTATVVEVIPGAYTGSGGTDFTVTTALVPTDVIVVVYARGTTSTSSVTGLGATWNSIFTLTLAADRAIAVYATGVTGGGTVTVNRGVAESGGVTIYVVRDLNSVTVTEQHSVWDSNNTAANTDEFTPSQPFGTDQVAILVGISAAGTTTFPSNPTPSTGWTVDLTRTSARRLFTAHNVGVTPGTATAAIRSASTTNLGIAMIVLGTETTTPPLVSTFIGWGTPIF